METATLATLQCCMIRISGVLRGEAEASVFRLSSHSPRSECWIAESGTRHSRKGTARRLKKAACSNGSQCLAIATQRQTDDLYLVYYYFVSAIQ